MRFCYFQAEWEPFDGNIELTIVTGNSIYKKKKMFIPLLQKTYYNNLNPIETRLVDQCLWKWTQIIFANFWTNYEGRPIEKCKKNSQYIR